MSTEHFFKEKVVLITGASSGIGKEMAGKILQWGGNLVITGRNEDRLRELEKSWINFGDRVLMLNADSRDAAACSATIEKTIARFGKLDVLVCNAALSSYGEIVDMPVQVINNMIDTNIKGPIFSVKAAAEELKKTKGNILLVSSLAAFRGLPNHGLYSLSKMSLTSLSQVLRAELSETPVKVGIAYVSFTENEPNKRTLNTKGEEEVIPQRNKWFISTREQTALKLLKQIAEGRKTHVHSFLGKLHLFLVRCAPGLIELLAKNIFQKTKHQSKISN